VWMQALLEFRITHGPLFRRILNDRIVEPLKDTAVREIVRDAPRRPMSRWESYRRTRCAQALSRSPGNRASHWARPWP